MEGNDVCKISIMAAFADYMLAGGDPCSTSFSDSLAPDASVEADRHHDRGIFPVHQSLIHAPIKSPRRLIAYSCFRATIGLAEAARIAL